MAIRDEIIQRVKTKALQYDKNYIGCGQSVLGSLQEELGLGDQQSFKSASVMAGGVARRGETCGAIIGALLALGLVIGRDRIEDTEQYQKAMEPAQDIYDRFKAELKKQFGFSEEPKTTLCRDIQEKVYGRSFNLRDENEYQDFLSAGGHSDTGCPKVCGIAAQVAAEQITELLERISKIHACTQATQDGSIRAKHEERNH